MTGRTITCDQAVEHAADLAVGSLTGEERGLLLAHLAECSACRRLSEGLAELVDTVMILAPDTEPPAGFAADTLAAMMAVVDDAGNDRRRSTRAPVSRTWLGVAALLLLFFTGLVVARSGLVGRARDGPAATASSGVTNIRSAALVGARGISWGQAYVHDGPASFVVVTMSWAMPDSDLTVELAGPDVPTVQIPGLSVIRGQGSLARMIAGDVRRVRTLRVIDRQGHELCRAEFRMA